MSKTKIEHIAVLKKERDRIEDCETYGFYPYNAELLYALEFILLYINKLEADIEEKKNVNSSR